MREFAIAFITKILQMCCRQKWNSNIFLHRNLFQRKNVQKRAKRSNIFFKASQLEMSPKGQLSFLTNQLETTPNFWNLA